DPSVPSAASPENRARKGPKWWARAIASAAMSPMLWRLRAWRAPGLPSPAMTSMKAPIDRAAEDPSPGAPGEGFAVYFLPGFGVAGAAALAGAAAAGAGAGAAAAAAGASSSM